MQSVLIIPFANKCSFVGILLRGTVMDPIDQAHNEEPMGKGKRAKSRPPWWDDFHVSKK
jgi:hypothetical protein